MSKKNQESQMITNNFFNNGERSKPKSPFLNQKSSFYDNNHRGEPMDILTPIKHVDVPSQDFGKQKK